MTNTNNTMTQREFLTAVLNLVDDAQVKAKATEMLSALDAKNKASAEKRKEKHKEDAPIVEAILATLANGQLTTAEIGLAVGVHPSKASALCRQMRDDGILTEKEVSIPKVGKRKAYSLVTA